MTRCCLFCLLWVVTNYMYVYSLRILDCTDVMALYSAHVSFVYLLSWVILHDQFVGVRVSSKGLCIWWCLVAVVSHRKSSSLLKKTFVSK